MGRVNIYGKYVRIKGGQAKRVRLRTRGEGGGGGPKFEGFCGAAAGGGGGGGEV